MFIKAKYIHITFKTSSWEMSTEKLCTKEAIQISINLKMKFSFWCLRLIYDIMPMEYKNFTTKKQFKWLYFATLYLLSKMIRFWICKDQNDLLHTAQHAEPLGGHIWSHFDWQFQSRRDQNPEFAFGVQSKHLFQYNSPKSKNGKPNFLYVVKDL